MPDNDGPMLSRGTLLVFAVIQVFAAKLLVQRLQDIGLLEVPPWVPFFSSQNCGHLKEYEYVLVSRNVITPEGISAAAGNTVGPEQITELHAMP